MSTGAVHCPRCVYTVPCMELIRTYQLGRDPARALCSIRTDTYASSFGHFIKLADAAYSEFPALCKDDIEVVVYVGQYIKRIRGVEFRAAAADVPDSYALVESLPCHI